MSEESRSDNNGVAKGSRKQRRRYFLKTTGVVGLGAVPLSIKTAQADEIEGGGGTPSVSYYSKQQDLVRENTIIGAGTRAEHLKSVSVDGNYAHFYKIANEFVQTDGSGNYIDRIAAQEFLWDATDTSADVDFNLDGESENVGAYPAPQSEGAVQTTFETVLKAAISAIDPKVAVSIAAAEVIDGILNWIDSKTNKDDQKKWSWNYLQPIGYVEEGSNQMDPIFEHSQGVSASWRVRSVADSLGNEVDFYAGSEPDSFGGDANPSNASLSASTGDERAAQGRKVARTTGLDRGDFHSLPQPADMTRKERKKFGVRKPTSAEQKRFSIRGERPQFVVERFPMTMVAEPAQQTQE